MEERELVGLLYRADWTGLTLAGTVRGVHTGLSSIFTERLSARAGRAWSGTPADALRPPLFTPPFPPPSRMAEPETEWTLVVAPGKRYREDSADGSYADGCDGERVWQWYQELPPAVTVRFDDRPRPPFPALLAPSWLLTGYELTVSGEETVQGRTGVRVRAVPRGGRRRGGQRWGLGVLVPIPPETWPWGQVWDEVDAVVDAELGILLRCSRRVGDQAAQQTEFTSLTVGGPVDPERFNPPPGSWTEGDRRGHPGGSGDAGGSGGGLGESLAESLGAFGREIGKEAAKTAAGLAAGGLGALIRLSSSSRQEDPFARATAEPDDPEPAMPQDEAVPDEPLAGAEPPAGDEVLHLLYRSGLGEPRVAATLHEWHDFGALLDAVPGSARRAGFGGVGFLVDSALDLARQGGLDTGHKVSSARVGGWDRYRIDVTLSPWNTAGGHRPGRLWHGRHPEPQTIACDGERCWKLYPDRVVSGPAEPLDGDLADLLDTSWLLAYELTGGEEVAVDGGRRAYRLVVRHAVSLPAQLPPGMSLWIPPALMAANSMLAGLFFPAVAVVDAESGRLLRLTRYQGGEPVLRQELRDVAGLDPDADFGFTPPEGLRVVEKTDWNRPEGPPPMSEFNQAWPDGTVGDAARAASDAVKHAAESARRFFGSACGGD